MTQWDSVIQVEAEAKGLWYIDGHLLHCCWGQNIYM